MDIVFDIETVPLESSQYLYEDPQSGELKDVGALSPITGRIIGAGWLSDATSHVFVDKDEKKILEHFWQSIEVAAKSSNGFIRLIGFNVKKFDMHFLLVRSLHHNVRVAHFNSKLVIDIRDYLSFFQTHMKKGTLDDYAKLIGLSGRYKGYKSEDIAQLWREEKLDELREFLLHDLKITQGLYVRCKETGIIDF